MPKSKKLTARPLTSTKAGKSLLIPSSNAGSVAKYRVHSCPVISNGLFLEKRGAFPFSSAFVTPL
jgi:hypothetical protein